MNNKFIDSQHNLILNHEMHIPIAPFPITLSVMNVNGSGTE